MGEVWPDFLQEGRVSLGIGCEQQDLIADPRQVAMQQTMTMLGIQTDQRRIHQQQLLVAHLTHRLKQGQRVKLTFTGRKAAQLEAIVICVIGNSQIAGSLHCIR